MSSKRAFTRLLVLSMILFAGQAYAQSTRIVALGDSNTAGFGVAGQEAFPAQLQAMLRARGYDVLVSNAGISGDTTQGMLGRLDSVVPQGTRIVIVQGGYNDLRRGGSPAQIMANIDAILSRLRARQIRAVLCGFYDQPWGAMAR
ncbi:MAG: GDSL-type esterase/lipase family protein, partial [Pseudomonadota bacterium]|nr:GDSL-type esterase/lipase family protein [Pseudomonadota bacterium]